ncbi:ThiF family adenylyltransferase [Micromonospora sp. DT4]|uniref:ThiF family adenylyltransferase n=1 Tax=Micromonospora sp. DT4 TaxID=3393438 RepID=UPI003CF7800E
MWFSRCERSVPLPSRDLPVFRTAFAADSVTTVVNGTAMPLADAVIGLLTGRGLILTAQAAAGDLWLSDGSRVDLAEVVIPSGNLIRLRPRPACAGTAEFLHDRQARRFGQLGQESLSRLRVAVVGLGGVGSILVEFLARLGVGGLVLIDDDIVNETNLPRLLAAERDYVGRSKTLPAVRNARRANPDIGLTVMAERAETSTARQSLNFCA